MEKKYICVNDFQGGSFGMYRTYTAEEWRQQAIEWADMDGWEEADKEFNFKNEQNLINYICEIWEIQIEELSIDNIEVVEYLLNKLKDLKDNILNFYDYQKEWIKETALEIGLITAEYCPYCQQEVLINRKGEKCNICGHFLKPCSLCDMDKVKCEECKIKGED